MSAIIFVLSGFSNVRSLLIITTSGGYMTRTHTQRCLLTQAFSSSYLCEWQCEREHTGGSTRAHFLSVLVACACERGSKGWGAYQIDASLNTLQLPDTMQNQYSVHTHTLLSALRSGKTHTHNSTLCCLLSWGLQLWLDHYSLLELPRGIPRICAHRVLQKAHVSRLTVCS